MKGTERTCRGMEGRREGREDEGREWRYRGEQGRVKKGKRARKGRKEGRGKEERGRREGGGRGTVKRKEEAEKERSK